MQFLELAVGLKTVMKLYCLLHVFDICIVNFGSTLYVFCQLTEAVINKRQCS